MMKEQCFADIAENDLENISQLTLNLPSVVAEPDIRPSQTQTKETPTSANMEKEEIASWLINVQSLEKRMLS